MTPADALIPTDEFLLLSFKESGDQSHFAEVFRRYKKDIYLHCLSIIRIPTVAEDVCQETFIRAFTGIHLFNGGSFSPWLHTIARNLSLNYLKSKVALHETQEISNVEPPDSMSGFDVRFSVLEEIRAILRKLPEAQRVCLKLLYLEGYTYKEIAAATRFSEKDVKTHVQNGKRMFRQLWEKIQKNKNGQHKSDE